MKIVFKNKDNSIGIITPSQEALSFATIKQIAEKDIPNDLPYWFIKDDDIPTDRTFRNAWRISPELENNPDGFGGENNEFDAELLAKYLLEKDKK